MFLVAFIAMLTMTGGHAGRQISELSCQKDVLAAVIHDDDEGAPFVLATQRGRAFRVLGQDFVDPALWLSGEELRLCPNRDVPRSYDLANRAKREHLAAVSVTTPLSQAAAATQVTALALERLRRSAPRLDVQYNSSQGSELLFSVHDRSGCSGGQSTCSSLVGHFAVDMRTGAIFDTDKREGEHHTR